MTYVTLFFASLLAATLLPGGSEALLLYDISNHYLLSLLFISATLGNTIGSVINYLIGRRGVDYLVQKGYAKERHLEIVHRFFDKYGGIALLLSWMPVVGDPITFIAGVMHYRFKWFLLLVFLAKALRYVVVIGIYFYLSK